MKVRGKLAGIFELSKYFISFDGAEYVPERVPVVDIGLKDLFGTTSTVAAPVAEEAAN